MEDVARRSDPCPVTADELLAYELREVLDHELREARNGRKLHKIASTIGSRASRRAAARGTDVDLTRERAVCLVAEVGEDASAA